MCSSFVFVLAPTWQGPLVVGTTTNLVRSVWLIKSKAESGLDADLEANRLVWFLECDTEEAASAYADRMEAWPETWLSHLIEETNPTWRDLWTELEGQPRINRPHISHASEDDLPPCPIIRRPAYATQVQATRLQKSA